MSVNKSNNKKRIFWTCFSVVWVLFIFLQSLLPAKASSAESGKIVEFLNLICRSIGFDFSFSSHFVRKSAHFFEFAVLGFALHSALIRYEPKTLITCIFTPLLYIAVAVSDECFQLISSGRACSFSDMLLDICGATFGFVLAIIFCFLKSKGIFKRGA